MSVFGRTVWSWLWV